MIEIKNLTKSFGANVVLNGIDASFAPGEIVGIVGRNGSGKSTFFNCISGRLSLDSGDILLDGQPLKGKSEAARVRLGIATTFQQPQSTESLGLDALIKIVGNRKEEAKLPPFTKAMERVHPEIRESALSQLSFGQRKLANILATFATSPRVLLLDEPIAGLSDTAAREIGGLLRGLSGEGVSVIIIEHDFDFIRFHTDRALLLHDGKILFDESSSTLMDRDEFVDIFR
uniref:Branched-chain amino acid transport system ATP-binding protein/branched-chain amino acid transport system permease protein n=1 Tax=Candidatus Kentrum sp. FW TaxID=2126338 RepID=A0A450U2P8_9GAMM|nr:MAG: branched-chain amino acid transport system ATP-binding protein/branched-chain amino acid transport system permease protein [Candidatus Kentron sp. FW]